MATPSETHSQRPPRRKRYRGTHPRRFHEKYKELDPESYPGTVQKVLESGSTPAGTHRPICLEEVLQRLGPAPGEVAVDATLGYGGHARELLGRLLPGGHLIGLDADPLELSRTEARLRGLGYGPDCLTVCHGNFAGLPGVLARLGRESVDMVLADLGCSSMQLDNPDRGFSYKLPGPLDLRMNPRKGRPASVVLAGLDRGRLVELLADNADEPHAQRIADELVRARGQITTTTGLATLVRRALSGLPGPEREAARTASVRRVFQALRIAVNDEFSAIEALLRCLPGCLGPGGRLVVLTFHSGEDRRVKRALRNGFREGVYREIARDVVRPGAWEVRANPRASSAKLRWAIRA
ncbi:MAG: 16S rRNA (cytosine(1402)-N(4))-methyltransferase RsmH [Candidatus Riflebacteria bacterium]|nr:16S rRNA (cytosine(1402)-N(4))-methyltransferase RsmH [Candidatus Riflebacteria bacterium]